MAYIYKFKHLCDATHFVCSAISVLVASNFKSLNLNLGNVSVVPLMESSASMYSIPKGRIGPGTGYKYSPFIDSLLSPLKNDYVYSPLENEKDIRLLHLHPGTDIDLIECSLVTHSCQSGPLGALGSQESYEALSYVWGNDEPTNMIRILSVRRSPDRSGQHRFSFRDFTLRRYYVRSNLFAALGRLRYADKVRVLWVDALCIDQSNITERNMQVAKMSEIYSNAEKVLVWLGEAADSSKLAFGFIDRVLGVDRLDGLVKDENTLDMWHALTNLMRRAWFSRRWVVQELALAKKALMQCGEDTVEWEKFSDAVGLFDMKFDDIVQLFIDSKKMQGEIESMFYVRALSGAYRLVNVLGNLFRRSADGQIKERLLNLEDLVLNLPSFQAKDPRDTIYALLCLARDTSPIPGLSPIKFNSFEVDYQKSVIAVFKDFVSFSIRRSGSLDIVCRHWAPAAGEKLPSWISPISKAALGIREDSHYVRLNADSLVDQQYAASRQSKASVFFGIDDVYYKEASGHNATMYVKGFRLDIIGDISTVAEQGYIRSDWFEKGCAAANGLPSVTEAFWRTLVANRGSDGKAPPTWYRLACRQVMNERKAGHLNISELIEDLRPAPDKGSELKSKKKRRPTIEKNPAASRSISERENGPVPRQQDGKATEQSDGAPPVKEIRRTSEATVKYLERVQRVAWNRKFLITEKTQSFGLCPAQARRGDLVVIFFGCSVPVLLRRKGNFPDCYHEVIGECYIYGMMDGEAMDGVACRDTEIFTLH